jgi:hypothetical protein
MTELYLEIPLRLPEGWNRTLATATVLNTQFASGVSINDAVRYLQDEVNAVNAIRSVLYTNYSSLLSDRTRAKKGQSEGASLEISVGNTKAFLACDKWRNLAQNLYALHLAIRHVRLFEEWGIATSEYMLSPFDVRKHHAPATSNNSEKSDTQDDIPDWMELLGLGRTATLADANAVYRQRAKGAAENEEAMIQLNQAIEKARRILSM